MTKSYTREEFTDYILGLKFYSVEDVSYFIRQYYNEYLKSDPEDDGFSEAYWRYMTVMCIHGPHLLGFVEDFYNAREGLNDLLKKIQRSE